MPVLDIFTILLTIWLLTFAIFAHCNHYFVWFYLILRNKTTSVLLSTVWALAQLFEWNICVQSLAVLGQSVYLVSTRFASGSMCGCSVTHTSNYLFKFSLEGCLRHRSIVDGFKTMYIIGWGRESWNWLTVVFLLSIRLLFVCIRLIPFHHSVVGIIVAGQIIVILSLFHILSNFFLTLITAISLEI